MMSLVLPNDHIRVSTLTVRIQYNCKLFVWLERFASRVNCCYVVCTCFVLEISEY